jgi:Tfp pilus assembly protein PilF
MSAPIPQEQEFKDRERDLGRDAFVLSLMRFLAFAAPDAVDVNVRLAADHARLVEPLHADRKEEREAHRRHREMGKHFSREALRLDPNRGDAHYWHGALLLHTADAEQSYGRLKEALKEMLSAEKLNPRCDSGGPDRMIGRIYQETPGGLFFLGSKPKAIEYYRKSLEIAPECKLTHLWLAETYQAEGQTDSARQEAQKAAQGNPRPGHEKEDEDVIRQAQELQKKMGSR